MIVRILPIRSSSERRAQERELPFVVVLSDVEFDDIGGMARPLVEAVIAD